MRAGWVLAVCFTVAGATAAAQTSQPDDTQDDPSSAGPLQEDDPSGSGPPVQDHLTSEPPRAGSRVSGADRANELEPARTPGLPERASPPPASPPPPPAAPAREASPRTAPVDAAAP